MNFTLVLILCLCAHVNSTRKNPAVTSQVEAVTATNVLGSRDGSNKSIGFHSSKHLDFEGGRGDWLKNHLRRSLRDHAKKPNHPVQKSKIPDPKRNEINALRVAKKSISLRRRRFQRGKKHFYNSHSSSNSKASRRVNGDKTSTLPSNDKSVRLEKVKIDAISQKEFPRDSEIENTTEIDFWSLPTLASGKIRCSNENSNMNIDTAIMSQANTTNVKPANVKPANVKPANVKPANARAALVNRLNAAIPLGTAFVLFTCLIWFNLQKLPAHVRSIEEWNDSYERSSSPSDTNSDLREVMHHEDPRKGFQWNKRVTFEDDYKPPTGVKPRLDHDDLQYSTVTVPVDIHCVSPLQSDRVPKIACYGESGLQKLNAAVRCISLTTEEQKKYLDDRIKKDDQMLDYDDLLEIDPNSRMFEY